MADKKKEDLVKKYLKSGFVKGFALKSALFMGILLGLNLFIKLYFRHTYFFKRFLWIPTDFYFPILTGLSFGKLMNAVIFTSAMFIIYMRKKIPDLKRFPFDKKKTIFFSVLSVIALIGQYVFKFWVRTNISTARSIAYPLTYVKLGINGLFVLFLALSIYGPDFIAYFLKEYKKIIVIFTALFFIYWGMVELFQNLWVYLSTAVTYSVGFLLRMTFNDVTILPVTPKGPQVGASGFTPYVSAECSGIDSLQLFISLFVFLLVLDWKILDKKKMAQVFLPGVLMTFTYNIIRVYLILLVGIFYDPVFAIDTFHTNIGWILFLGVFYLFWNFASEYVYLKKSEREKLKKKEGMNKGIKPI